MLQNIIAIMLAGRDEEKGATAVEYGLMVALIAVVIITAVSLLGDNLSAMFDGVAGDVADTGTGTGS
jgi:pilus assembly protein Flp/PilA